MQENNYDINNNQEDNSLPPRQPLGKKQKMAAAFLVVFALVFVGLWIVQFKKNLKEPFAPKSSQNTTDNNLKEDNQADLRLIDTDKDSLSDWDELNIYKTSPYLEDTDSDGILDRDEIKNGENPNCPKGQICEDSLMEDDASDDGGDVPVFNLNIGTSSQGQTDLQGVLEGQADAAALRKSLLEAGMDPNMLNKIDDDTLMKSYQEVLNKK